MQCIKIFYKTLGCAYMTSYVATCLIIFRLLISSYHLANFNLHNYICVDIAAINGYIKYNRSYTHCRQENQVIKKTVYQVMLKENQKMYVAIYP